MLRHLPRYWVFQRGEFNQIATEGEVFQREADGKFNIPVCVKKYYKDKYASEEGDSVKKLKWEAELKKLKAEEAELKNAVARGEYINKDEITADNQTETERGRN